MTTKLVYDIATGETHEVEMTGEELDAHERLLSIKEPEQPPTFDELVAAAVERALKAQAT